MTFSLKSNSFACFYQIGSRLSWSRNYASKDIRIGVEARAGMLKGDKELVDGIKVTTDRSSFKCQKTIRFSPSHNLKK
jgi:hypothetical protein